MTPAQEKQALKKLNAKKARKTSAEKKPTALIEKIKKCNRAAPHSGLAMKNKAKKLKAVADEKKESEEQQALENTALLLKNDGELDDVPVNHELALAQLAQHHKQLKGLSIDEKRELKERFIPVYMNVLNAYRKSGQGYPNSVLTTIVIWMLDCGLIDEAMDWGLFAIYQGQRSPKGFKRDFPTALAEELYDWADKQFKRGLSVEPYFEKLLESIESKLWPIDEIIVESKICKLAGNIAVADNDNANAVKWYQRCVDVNPEKSGAKTALDKAKKALERESKSQETT